MLSQIRHFFKNKTNIKTIIIPEALKKDLDLRERMELRQWLDLPTTKKVLGLMEAMHPGTNLRFPTYARSDWDAHAAVSFLSKVKGWESYRDTLLSIADIEQKQIFEPEEKYPSPE